MSIDDYNFARDSRNQGSAPTQFWLDLENGDSVELPTTWGVCDGCDGEGKHVNPAIDAGGLSVRDLDDDPDFAASYFGGDYDVTCNKCQGRTTIRVVDFERMSPDDVAAYDRQEREYERDRLDHYYEIRAGA